jgi:DNA-binding beta-propeller fold protein YncE
VIDTVALKRIKTVPTKGSIHNAYVTPDGKYVVAGSIQGKTINVIDAQTDEPAWTLDMDLGVRPMTFSWNPDGSTQWIFAQLSGLNGFAVVDFATKKRFAASTIRSCLPESQPSLRDRIRPTAWR